jgi:hypothetical protein
MQLKKSTLAQGQTLTDLEYTMVLDNIAMQRQMPGGVTMALESHPGQYRNRGRYQREL